MEFDSTLREFGKIIWDGSSGSGCAFTHYTPLRQYVNSFIRTLPD